MSARITLFSRPGCHLCDDAREVIRRVAEDLRVSWEERDITLSAADMREYWDKIPVTLVDGVQHDFWRVSEARLRSALTARPGASRLLGSVALGGCALVTVIASGNFNLATYPRCAGAIPRGCGTAPRFS